MTTSPDTHHPRLQAWAQYLHDVVPSLSRQIHRYGDEQQGLVIDVFHSEHEGRDFAASLGLLLLDQGNGEWPLHIELIMDARGHQASIDDLVASLALHILSTGDKVAPGTLYEDLFGYVNPGLALQHLVLLDPIGWDDQFSKVTLEGQAIYPLMMVPISEAECRYIEQHGLDAFEERIQTTHADLLNWQRDSII